MELRREELSEEKKVHQEVLPLAIIPLPEKGCLYRSRRLL